MCFLQEVCKLVQVANARLVLLMLLVLWKLTCLTKRFSSESEPFYATTQVATTPSHVTHQTSLLAFAQLSKAI